MNSKLAAQNVKQPTYVGLVRWAFARFYREFAWTYETVAAAVSGGQWFAWGRAAMPFLGGLVLELGCGTGQLQRALSERTDIVPVGLDASPQMLAIAARKLNHRRALPLTRAVAQALPFQSAAFDAIVATFPSEYILDRATLAEVRRVLKPGGRVVIVLAAGFRRDDLYARLVDLLYRLTLQRAPRVEPSGPPHSQLGERLRHSRFATTERWEPVGDASVHLIVATKAD